VTGRTRKILQWGGVALLSVLAAGVIAPYLSANRFGGAIQRGLERGLGRRVDIGAAHFDLFTGPGFSIDEVVIYEDASVGPEPFAYVSSLEAVPRLLPLLRGRLEFASIRLDDASINLVKSGAASDPGHWNFEPLLNRSLMATFPEIHVRSSRINFKFGLTKSIFYLTDTDLDVAPPWRWDRGWTLRFSGAPARTDRPAGGFGRIAAEGHWYQGREGQPDRLDLDLELAKGNISEIIALVHGQHAGIHGAISSRMHLAGPWDHIRIAGRVSIEDVHRWDLMPAGGDRLPLNLQGQLDLTRQKMELVSSAAGRGALPLSVRFRLSDYLFQPHWGVAVNWNQFPTGAVLELARHMGVPVPVGLKMSGIVDGAIGYEGQGGVQGALSFHNTIVAMPDSPGIRFEEAAMLFAGGHVRLSPTIARVPAPGGADALPCPQGDCSDQVQVEADFTFATNEFSLGISSGAMHVGALRAQAALARVPWLEQIGSGVWSGQLRYVYKPEARCEPGIVGCLEPVEAAAQAGWSGRIQLGGAQIPLAGVASPLEVKSVSAQIDRARVTLDHLQAEVGGVTVRGDYHYEPRAARPHRLHLVIPTADAIQLERLLNPTLYRSRSLLARALGRVGIGRGPLPEWLTDRRMEGTVQIGSLALAGTTIENLRARLIWDLAKVELNGLQASVEGGAVAGKLAVNLRGMQPAYQLDLRLKGLSWKSGKVDAELTAATRGLGEGLLTNLQAKGSFEARALDLRELPPMASVSGSFTLAWAKGAANLAFPELQVTTAGGLYTGRGETGDDGRLLIQLSNGAREMRMSGTLAQMRVEEPVVQ